MERSDIPLKHDKAIIEIAKDRRQFKPNKPGTLNYSTDNQELYVTVKSKGPRSQRPEQTDHDSYYQGEFYEILTRNMLGGVKGNINILGNLTVRDSVNVLGQIYEKEIKKLSIENPMIELNANEKDYGNTLKRAGVNINRGLLGSANMLYDETLQAFNFCLDPNNMNQEFAYTQIVRDIYKLSSTGNGTDFKIPVNIKDGEVAIFFLNSIKILPETDYEIVGDTLKTRENLGKISEITMIKLSIKQFDKMEQEINENKVIVNKTHRAFKIKKDTTKLILNPYREDSPYYDGFEYTKKSDTLLVFVNGTYFGENLYEIKEDYDDIYIELQTSLDPGTEVYVISITPEVPERNNRVFIKNEYHNIIISKDENKQEIPTTVDKHETCLVFVNSVLMDSNTYIVEGNEIAFLNRKLKEGTILEIVKIFALTTSPELDTISHLMEKDDFKILATIDNDSTIKSNKYEGEELDVKTSGHIQDLKVTQQAGTEYGLDVYGNINSRGRFDANGLSNFNDEVTFNDKVTTNKKVKHNDWVVHGKHQLYLNDNLEKDNGGIVFERSKAPHAIIKWNETVKRWFAGIEGTEQVIITKDMLYSIIEKLIDISGIDDDIHTSVEIEQAKPYIASANETTVVPVRFGKLKNTSKVQEYTDGTYLVFLNGRYVSEDEYKYENGRLILNGTIAKGSIVYVTRLKMIQESLTGYPIRDSDKVAIEKEYYQLEARDEGGKEYILPFDLNEFKNSNIVFLNGILLTRDLYNIDGSLLTLNFDPQIPTVLTIISFNTVKGESLSRIELISRPIKMTLDEHQINEVKYKLPSRIKGTDKFLAFCNTTFIHQDDYYIKDDYFILKGKELDGFSTVTNPPTEISIVEFLPVKRGGCSSQCCNNNVKNKNISVKVPKGHQYVMVPFTLNKNNPSIMVFLNGNILSRDQYEILGNMVKLNKEAEEESTLYVTEFVNNFENPDDLTGKGTRTFEFKDKKEFEIPFNVKDGDTNMMFINGLLIDSSKYFIDGNKVSINTDLETFSGKLMNMSNVKNIEYNNVSRQLIVEHNTEDEKWEIQHNLNTYPTVTVIDDNKQVIREVRITYSSENKITLEFDSPKKGKVILN